MIFLKVILSDRNINNLNNTAMEEKVIDSIESIEKALNTIREGLGNGRISVEDLEPLLQRLSRPFVGNQAYEQLGPYPLVIENEEEGPVIIECWLLGFWQIVSYSEVSDLLELTDFRAADAEELKEFVANHKRLADRIKIAALSEVIWKKSFAIKCEYSYSYSKIRGLHLHRGSYDVDWKILVVKKTP
jgi:hypothetical protein